jgi:hypothetical protein
MWLEPMQPERVLSESPSYSPVANQGAAFEEPLTIALPSSDRRVVLLALGDSSFDHVFLFLHALRRDRKTLGPAVNSIAVHGAGFSAAS